MLDINHQEDWFISVFSEDLVDLDIMGSEGVAGGVPTDEFFLLTDLPHHVEHLLVVEVIQEPDAGLAGVLFEGYSVAVDYLNILVIHVAWMKGEVPRRAPTTLLLRCLRLTLLKWSTIERRTRG